MQTISAPHKRPRRTDTAALPFRWQKNGRSREGELFRRVCRDLRRHVGGRPTAAEELLIGRIAWLQVHLAHIDERAMEAGGLSDHATREYLAWSGALARLLDRLGLKEPPPREPTVQEILAAIHAPRPIAEVDGGEE